MFGTLGSVSSGGGGGGSSLSLSLSNVDQTATANVSQLASNIGGTITYTKVSGSSNVAINSTTGYITLTAPLGNGGTNTFVARAASSNGTAVEKSFTLTGIPVAVGTLMSSRTVQAGFGNASGSNGTTDIDSNSRTSHFNNIGATVSKLKLLYANWYVTSAGTPVEVAGPNNYTITAAVEYPAGVFNPVTISTITAGSTIVSSEVTLSTPIPNGAQFWVRQYVVVSAGQKWMLGYQMNANQGELCDRNSGVDKTQSGTIVGSSNGMGPLGIVATAYSSGTPVTTIFAGFGDSTVEGATVNIQDIHGNQGWVGYACTSNAPYVNLSRGGSIANNQVGVMTKRLQAMTLMGVTHCVCGWGTNDFVVNRTSAQVIVSLQAIWDAITANGQKVLANTIAPVTAASSWNLPGTTQTPSAWSGTDGTSDRAVVNAFIRTANPSVFQVLETADILETGRNTGLWKFPENFASPNTNPRIPPPLDVIIGASSTTTVFNTNLTVGNGITTNMLSGQSSFIVFTSGVNAGLNRALSANSNGATNVTTTTPLTTAPSNGDTATIYRVSVSFDGTHSKAIGHNSLMTLYYGGAWLEADYLCNLYFGKNATA